MNISNSECIHIRILFPRGIMAFIMESINLHWQVIPLQTCDIHVWTVVFLRGKYVLPLYFLLRHVVDTSWPVQLYLNHFSATLNNPSIPAAPVAWSVCNISCRKESCNRYNLDRRSYSIVKNRLKSTVILLKQSAQLTQCAKI